MNNHLITLTLFELKKNKFLSNLFFLLINMVIIPFTIEPSVESLPNFFLSSIMSSILLASVLITHNIFDEDFADGSLNQYQVFGIPMHIIYLSKIIAVTLEFTIIICISFPIASLFYEIPIQPVLKLLLATITAIPLLMSISVFGALLTSNIEKNSVISILLIFPLMLSCLILLSLAGSQILNSNEFVSALPFIEINLGLTMLLLPALCLMTRFLK